MEERKFSRRSECNLEGVHPSLVMCARIALQKSACDFTVVEGVRDIKTQRRFLETGASRTMKSYHLKQSDGYGHAIDVYPFYDGRLQGAEKPRSAEERQRNEQSWKEIARAMKEAAVILGIRVTWGGDWESFVDMPHFQYEGRRG